LKLALATSLAVLASCGHYAEFTLPAPAAAGPAGPFTWEARAQPVLTRDAAIDVLNPSVVLFRGAYWNFYSEYDGTAWHTAAATSPDGITWNKQGRVLSPPPGTHIAANGSALVVGGEILYWYETGYPLRIALARSNDGVTWKRSGVVFESGPYRSFDERAVADPYVIRAGEHFFMFYLGQDRAARQRLGVARSSDGLNWEKLRRPVLEGSDGGFDEELGEPAVWTSGAAWWMLYTGRARDERRRLGLARSADGVVWTRVKSFLAAGDQPWSSQVLADPTVEVSNPIRVWFGAGDVASPDQNLHGQIGLGLLR
jgi:sucrose-6-phosphate hydrolase SacC (GH32 family)